MNNWRGGWTVGPRYLALVVPFMAWGALEGGRMIASIAPRLAGALAIGATATAMVASGGPSAYYPHIPEAFTRPLPQLIRPLVQHDFAPSNAGSWLAEQLGTEWSGTASMVPLFLLGLFALAWIAWTERQLSDRLLVLIGATFFGSALLAPLVRDDPGATGVTDALAYVVRFWYPPGHDRAARLEERLRRGAGSEADWQRLVQTYEAEGRLTEARDAERRARAAGYQLGSAPRTFVPVAPRRP
jgi:YD repeat-containing protein